MMTTNNNSGFSSYAGSPGGSSSAPYHLVDIGSGQSASYNYLTGGGGIVPAHPHHHLQHHGGYLSSPDGSNGLIFSSCHPGSGSAGAGSNIDQVLVAANTSSGIGGYIEAGRAAAAAAAAAVAAAAVHPNAVSNINQLYMPTNHQQSQQQQQQQQSSQLSMTGGAPTSCATPAPTAARGQGKKRKHAGVDKKVYQATMKPIIERQRRARINSSLEELHNLLKMLTGSNLRTQRQPTSPTDSLCGAGVSSGGGMGNNARRIEKADILEQAVRFIKTLQSQGSLPSNGQIASPGASSSSSSSSTSQHPPRPSSPNSQPNGLQLAAIQQAFCAGYAECTRLTTSWLATYQDGEKLLLHGGDESQMSHGDNDSDSLGDDEDGDAFLGTEDDEDGEPKSNGSGQQLRAKLEDHLISRLNDRLTAHLTKCLPPAASSSSSSTGRQSCQLPPMMQQQFMPTPPQSPKDLLLPLSLGAACAAAAAGGNSGVNMSASNAVYVANGSMTGQSASNGGSIQQHQFSPISPFTATQQQQQQQQLQPVSGSSNSDAASPTVIYYDPSNQSASTSAGATGGSISSSSSSSSLNPLMAEFIDPKDPVALNNAMMFNNFVAQLTQTQRAAAAASLYCWRPWD